MAKTEELLSPTFSANMVRTLQMPLALDLVAAYALMRDEALALVGRADREGWTPEQFIAALQGMLATDGAIG